jgi:type I restriction enzyme R subunit
VADRHLRKYRAAQEQLRAARDRRDSAAEKVARDEMEALKQFKGTMGAFVRAYAFLSQIFDYGNTDVEKRAIFYKRLMPLLEFGREREGVDLSKVVLTHHRLRDLGKQGLSLTDGQYPQLDPMRETGGHEVRDPTKERLSEIITRVNDLFGGEATENDKLVYVNNVIKGKLLESEILVQQAASNTKEQFANSPDLGSELMNAIIDSFAAHSTMSQQALDSEDVRRGLKDILLGPAQLYEALRNKPASSP